jgi:N-methylhydantoinase B
VADTIFKALAKAVPDRVIAGHHADLMSVHINGKMPNDGRLFIVNGGLIGGGWGATSEGDGSHVTICINDGDTHNSPLEQLEAKYPMIVERYALREDSGGAGLHQGGLGAEYVCRAMGEFMFNAGVERVHCRPWGLFDGHPGAGNEVSVRLAGEPELRFPSGKVYGRALKPGDAYILRSGGGGGYGSPLDRPLSQIESDLRQGYISRERAEGCYGVCFDEAGTMDEAASAARRAALRADGEFTERLARLQAEDAGASEAQAANAAEGRLLTGGRLFPLRCC